MRDSLRGLFAAVLVLAAAGARAEDARQFDELDREAAQTQDDGLTMEQRVDRARAKMRDDADAATQAQTDAWSTISAETRAQYAAYEKARAEQAAAFRLSVAQQWTDFRDTTRKEWVDYSAKNDARSEVDFEKGRVRVEVLVPVEEVAPGRKIADASALNAAERARLRAIAEDKIRAQTRKVLSEKEPGSPEVLKDQIRDAKGTAVTAENAEAFLKNEVAPRIVVESAPVVAQDERPRIKVVVEFPLVPDHLRVRAARYKPLVERYAAKYALAPELIYAVIQTESEFNPKARSGAGAVGLMQLVPRTAAREARLFLRRGETPVTVEELYDPEANIELGATYLFMLSSREFGKVKNLDNRLTLSIAAYNSGPGGVRRAVTSHADPDALSGADLQALIRKNSPAETVAYVSRVRKRMPLYQGF